MAGWCEPSECSSQTKALAWPRPRPRWAESSRTVRRIQQQAPFSVTAQRAVGPDNTRHHEFKFSSTRYLRAEYTARTNRIGMGCVFRSRSYFAGSCGGAPLTLIRQYIERQNVHCDLRVRAVLRRVSLPG
ncbi:transposase [Streptomyces sp. NPDC048324]|uniref:transposase n=1 Tax=Streptomyces sp. NPDC048324 TaxID=3157205 RepID=UPI00342A2FD5